MRPVQQTPARTHSVTKCEVSSLPRWPQAVSSNVAICAGMDVLRGGFVVD
jgi:hypothetical protein